MKFDYAPLLDTANLLIGEFGKTAILTTETTTGDPWNPATMPETHDCTIVEVTYGQLSRIAQSLVQTGDRTGLIAVGPYAPKLSDTITIDGETFVFVHIKPLQPGDTLLLWEFVARA